MPTLTTRARALAAALPVSAALLCVALQPEVAAMERAAALDEVPGDPARVDLEIVRGDVVLKHPGLIAETGRQVVLTLTETIKRKGESTTREHAVALRFDSAGEGAYHFSVEYTVAGARVLAGVKDGGARQWISFAGPGGVTVKLRVDPSDTDKGDIDITPTDDPLEGIG